MITVDVILLCYNQEQYIEQALRSIYIQKLPNDIQARVYVADDCSTDSTLDVIKHLASESPFPMEFLTEEPNLGISKNYKRSFAATRADFVAVLEGDDWWISDDHLARHVRYLIEHPECAMSANRFYETTLDGKLQMLSKWHESDDEVFINIHDQIVEGNQLGNLSACCFRSNYIHQLPENIYSMHVDDYIIGIMMAKCGEIAILQKPTSVYRCNPNSMWASLSEFQKLRWNWNHSKAYDRFLQFEYHKLWVVYRKNIVRNFLKDNKRRICHKTKRFFTCYVYHS